MATDVQSDYRRNINRFQAGMVSNTRPNFRESGRLVTGGTENYPESLPFGYACGWIGEGEVARDISYRPFALLGANLNNSATSLTPKGNEFFPGIRHVSAGDLIIIDTEWMRVTAIGSGAALTVRRGEYASTAATHSADAPMYVVGGSTNFAGVAVKDLALPGANTPTDTYNQYDHVSIGSDGDFTVVCREAVKRGDHVSVYTGATAADYGKFSNESPVHDSRSYIGIPGATFMTDSVSTAPYDGSANILLAVMRLTAQPR